LRDLRTELIQVRTALGIARTIVPHMFRHYATSRTMPPRTTRSGWKPWSMLRSAHVLITVMRHSPEAPTRARWGRSASLRWVDITAACF
jgi:hypothetical protein